MPNGLCARDLTYLRFRLTFSLYLSQTSLQWERVQSKVSPFASYSSSGAVENWSAMEFVLTKTKGPNWRKTNRAMPRSRSQLRT